ncbi:MAG TPA: hypothetical protein VMM13_13985 [Euzebya sp.]|nr:hypothetical protein [Euzebya sp.]
MTTITPVQALRGVQRFGTVGRGAVRLGTLRAAMTLLEEHL